MSHEVLSRMKALMVESAASAASHSFLLDEDSALPFTQDDVAAFMDDKVRRGLVEERSGADEGEEVRAGPETFVWSLGC